MTPLDQTITIYFPSKNRHGFDLNGVLRKEHLLSLEGTMVGHFGGVTISEAEGAFEMPSGGLVREHITLVTSYTTKSRLDVVMKTCLHTYLLDLGHDLNQESLAFTINGTMYLLPIPTEPDWGDSELTHNNYIDQVGEALKHRAQKEGRG